MAAKVESNTPLTCRTELNTMKFKGWIRFRMSWGRRRTAPGRPAPPLSVPDTYMEPQYHVGAGFDIQSQLKAAQDRPQTAASQGTNTDTSTDGTGMDLEELYQVEIYKTKEESLQSVRRRVALRGALPPPLVSIT